MSHNQLSDCSGSKNISNFPALYNLKLSINTFTTVPKLVFAAKNLVRLLLDHNCLFSKPDLLNTHKKLRCTNLGYKEIYCDHDIQWLKQIRYVDSPICKESISTTDASRRRSVAQVLTSISLRTSDITDIDNKTESSPINLGIITGTLVTAVILGVIAAAACKKCQQEPN